MNCDQCSREIKGTPLILSFPNWNEKLKWNLCSKECYSKKSSQEMREIVMFDMSSHVDSMTRFINCENKTKEEILRIFDDINPIFNKGYKTQMARERFIECLNNKIQAHISVKSTPLGRYDFVFTTVFKGMFGLGYKKSISARNKDSVSTRLFNDTKVI